MHTNDAVKAQRNERLCTGAANDSAAGPKQQLGNCLFATIAHCASSRSLCAAPSDWSLFPGLRSAAAAAVAAMDHSMELTKESESYKLGAAARTAAGVIIKQTHAAPKNPGAKPEEVRTARADAQRSAQQPPAASHGLLTPSIVCVAFSRLL